MVKVADKPAVVNKASSYMTKWRKKKQLSQISFSVPTAEKKVIARMLKKHESTMLELVRWALKVLDTYAVETKKK